MITTEGRLTVDPTETVGATLTVRATSKEDPGKTKTAAVTIADAGKGGGALVVRNVCDATGCSTDSTDYAVRGKYVYAGNNRYQFYVDIAEGGSLATPVNMVMPMGGPEAGLFRFPRVGEQVLVCHSSNGYYFMGFAPSTSAPFYPEAAAANRGVDACGYNPSQRNPGNMNDFLNDNGMALRYKKEDNLNDGGRKTTGSGAFSEIGFYNKKAKWPDAIKRYNDGEEAKKEQRLPEDRFSRIDVLNIQSTGDIESRAGNYHLLKAKRVEILSDMGEIGPERRIDNCVGSFGEGNTRGAYYTNWQSTSAPLGDNPMDDPAVHGGDIHIRANKNGIFKAAEEIRLQVGRTCLVITDGGISVATRKVNSNVPTPNDTVFDMTPREGISMFGESVNITSARKFSLSDAWGASVGSMVGVLNIAGRQITQQTYDLAREKVVVGMNAFTLARNITAGTLAAYPQKAIPAGVVELSFDWIKLAIDIADFAYSTAGWKNPDGVYKTLKANLRAVDQWNLPNQVPTPEVSLKAISTVADAEPVECLMAALDMVLAISAAVYTTVEQAAALQLRQDLSSSVFDGTAKYWGAQVKSDFSDKLNLCAMCIDGGIIAGAMAGNLATGIGGPASIRLRQNGDAIIKAGAQKSLYGMTKQEAAVPASIWAEKAAAAVKTGLAITKLATGATSKLILQPWNKAQKMPLFVEKQ
jgi:hypothetical protein